MSDKYTINIAKDFSRFPGGRFRTDGKYSGEAFREDILLPKLRKYKFVSINMDGTLSYGSSFLEESFGGLVRKHKFEPDGLLQKIEIVSKDPSIEFEIKHYIKAAGR